MQERVRRLKSKLAIAIETDSVVMDDETLHDLQTTMEEEERNMIASYPDDSFQSVFRNQHKKSKSKKRYEGAPFNVTILLILTAPVKQSL